MRSVFVALICALCFYVVPSTGAQAQERVIPKLDFSMNKYGRYLADPRYKERVKRILEGERGGFNFELFRIYYSRTELYDASGEGVKNRLLQQAYIVEHAASEPEAELAMKDYLAILYAHMGNIDVVAQALSLARENERFGDPDMLQWVKNGLLKSVLRSGSGQSFEKAFKIYTMAEERFLMGYFHAKILASEDVTKVDERFSVHRIIPNKLHPYPLVFVNVTEPLSYLEHQRERELKSARIPTQN